ncbi:TadE/TadG family type IV pilus assembly protein [Variovorax paradoxus]|uniref:TadE/TadG family type IV pilus assembly protein n=1 Tax=Variovorax paradoxus TaxID=34073 RepID=UPI0019327906|nr:pilus assembly protein [Variovorax paradoxus]
MTSANGRRNGAHRRAPAKARLQRGIYAVEFGIVFLIFFTVLYAIICFAIIFTLRFGLQNAAEDGARAALRYQTSLGARETEARSVARQRASGWLPVAPSIDAKVCQVGTTNCTEATRSCGAQWTQRCQIVVTVKVQGMQAVLPPLPSFAAPDTLVGRASMLLDGRSP